DVPPPQPVTASAASASDGRRLVVARTGGSIGAPARCSSLGGQLQVALEDQDVAPTAVAAAVPAVDADVAEPGPAGERQAGRVLREDHPHQLPVAERGRLDHEVIEHEPPEAPPARVGRDVDRVLADPAVPGTVRERGDRRPAAHPPVALGDEDRRGRRPTGQPPPPLLRRVRAGGERRHPAGDRLIVDLPDRPRVAVLGPPDLGCRGYWQVPCRLLGRSASLSGTFSRLLPRSTVTRSVSPTLRLETASLTSAKVCTVLPSTATITSAPRGTEAFGLDACSRPAALAGPRPSTRVSATPVSPGWPRAVAMAGVSSVPWIPIQAWWAEPVSRMDRTMGRIVSIGIAKPMPSLPPLWLAIWELMPITRPRPSSSGPPELPWLIAASVWI